MKSYTNIEESKKLAEILPIESADMSWVDTGLGKSFARTIPCKGHPEEICPCWSLAALIEVLPLSLDIHNISDGHKIYYYVELYTKEIYMKLKRMNKPEICLSTVHHENLVDACVEMIFTLKARNLL